MNGNPQKQIPVIMFNKETEQNDEYIWSLNVRNPTYKEIIEGLVNGIKSFKILRTGQNKETRYTILKD